MFLVQDRGEMWFTGAVTSVLLQQIAIDRGTDGSFVSTGKSVNGGYVCC